MEHLITNLATMETKTNTLSIITDPKHEIDVEIGSILKKSISDIVLICLFNNPDMAIEDIAKTVSENFDMTIEESLFVVKLLLNNK